MIGIIGAMEDELAILRSAIVKPHIETSGAFDFIVGALEGEAVVLLRCGIGKVNAAIGCALLITTYKPDLVINTGSAGGIDPGLHFGDAVISNGLVYHDVDVRAFNYAPGQVPGLPQVFPIAEELIIRAEQAINTLKQEQSLPSTFNYVRGLIGSGDVFMHEPDRIGMVRRLFPDLKAVEMEGAAIAHACYLFKVPVLIIRALSDIAGIESPLAFNEFLPMASQYSAAIVRRLVRDY
jgi:adenosylhomocysteine nucleosidase